MENGDHGRTKLTAQVHVEEGSTPKKEFATVQHQWGLETLVNLSRTMAMVYLKIEHSLVILSSVQVIHIFKDLE